MILIINYLYIIRLLTNHVALFLRQRPHQPGDRRPGCAATKPHAAPRHQPPAVGAESRRHGPLVGRRRPPLGRLDGEHGRQRRLLGAVRPRTARRQPAGQDRPESRPVPEEGQRRQEGQEGPPDRSEVDRRQEVGREEVVAQRDVGGAGARGPGAGLQQ